MQPFRKGIRRLRVLALTLAAALALAPAFPAAGEPATADEPDTEETLPVEETIEGALVLENKSFRLTLNPEDGNLYLHDLRNGMRWYSNPSDARDDEVAIGMFRTNLLSQLIVEYTDINRTKAKMNSYVGAVAQGTAVFRKTDKGIRADFEFAQEEFTIPVRYSLTEYGLKAEILADEIKEGPENKVNSIELLPYFGAGGMKDKGYILIPDGCGAVIDFNNGKAMAESYRKEVYGGDQTKLKETQTSRDYTIELPVFGLARENGAFLAVIDQGAPCAQITAGVSGHDTSYNAVNSVFVYRESELRPLIDQENKKKTILFNALDPAKLKTYSVEYRLLQDTGVAAMAQAYRDYLQQQGSLQAKTDGKVRLYLDLYGGVLRAKQFLGFRYDGFQPLTTYDQAADILKDLSAAGVGSMVVGYRQFNDDALRGRMRSKVNPAGQLGGRRAYEALCETAAALSADIYPEGDFVRFSKGGMSYSSLSGVVLGTNLTVAKQYPFAINTSLADQTRAPWYYVRPDRYDKALSTLKSSLGKLPSKGLYLTDAARLLYSDFSKDSLQKDQTVGKLQQAFAELAEADGLLMAAPNAYALPYAQRITDLPVESGGHRLFDRDVPFVQMALRGLMEFSGEAVNIAGANRAALLRHIEAGSNIKFALMANEPAVLNDTKDENLYGAYYDSCQEQIKDWYAQLASVLEATAGATVRDYTSVGDLKRIAYTNGVTVYVNYADQDVTAADGTSVAAESFVVKGGRS